MTTNATMTPAVLVEFLGATLFSPSDDTEAGSYDQQQQWFADEAEDLALTLLESSATADRRAKARLVCFRLDHCFSLGLRSLFSLRIRNVYSIRSIFVLVFMIAIAGISIPLSKE